MLCDLAGRPAWMQTAHKRRHTRNNRRCHGRTGKAISVLIAGGGAPYIFTRRKDIHQQAKAARRRQGDVRIARPSQRVSEVLKLAGLESIFSLHADLDTAVASFAARAA